MEYTISNIKEVLTWYKVNNLKTGWNSLQLAIKNLETKTISNPNDICGIVLWNSIVKDSQKLGYTTSDEMRKQMAQKYNEITVKEQQDSSMEQFIVESETSEFYFKKIQKYLTPKQAFEAINFYQHKNNPLKWNETTSFKSRISDILMYHKRKYYKHFNLSHCENDDFFWIKQHLAKNRIYSTKTDKITNIIEKYENVVSNVKSINENQELTTNYNEAKFNELFNDLISTNPPKRKWDFDDED